MVVRLTMVCLAPIESLFDDLDNWMDTFGIVPRVFSGSCYWGTYNCIYEWHQVIVLNPNNAEWIWAWARLGHLCGDKVAEEPKSRYNAYASESNEAVLIELPSGKKMQINCTSEQYLEGMRQYREGALMQNAFPFLDANEREFLMTGITPHEWDNMFGLET